MVEAHELFQRVDAYAHALVLTLSDLLRFETVSGGEEADAALLGRFEAETRRCLDYLRAFAQKHDLPYREHPEGVGVIEWGEGDETIGFAAHTDVVPPGDGWTQDPFGGAVVNDTVYGRGAQDNKGPLACGLYALLAVRALGRPTRRKIRLIFGTREEGGNWTDIAAYLRKEPPPVNTIVPDATFPIINGEKGMLNIRLRLAAVHGLERKDGLRLDSIHAGERFNIVPDLAVVRLSGPLGERFDLTCGLQQELDAYEKSRLILLGGPLSVAEDADAGRFIAAITFRGRSAHGSRPEEGHNAAVDALGYLVRLDLPAEPAADFLGWAYCAGKDTVGEYLGVDHFHEFVGLSTASLNMLHLDAQGAEAIFNVRHSLGSLSGPLLERVRRELETHIPNPGGRPAIETYSIVHEPLFVDPQEFPEFFAALREAYRTATGREPRLKATGGTTYAKAFPRAVSFGPVDEDAGEADLAHKADECVTREVLVRNARIYAHALAALCLT